jgi:hypothetical protein
MFHPSVDAERVGSRWTMIQYVGQGEKDFHLDFIQVSEDREQKKPRVGFKGQRPEESRESYRSDRRGFPYTSVGHSLDSRRYPQVREGKVADVRGLDKGNSWMDWKTCWYRIVQQHMSFQVCVQCRILSVGHFPCYGSLDLTLIKESLD